MDWRHLTKMNYAHKRIFSNIVYFIILKSQAGLYYEVDKESDPDFVANHLAIAQTDA